MDFPSSSATSSTPLTSSTSTTSPRPTTHSHFASSPSLTFHSAFLQAASTATPGGPHVSYTTNHTVSITYHFPCAQTCTSESSSSSSSSSVPSSSSPQSSSSSSSAIPTSPSSSLPQSRHSSRPTPPLGNGKRVADPYPSAARVPSKKRKALTAAQKLRMIDEYRRSDRKLTQKEAATLFSVSEATFSNMLKDEDLLRQQVSNGSEGSHRRGTRNAAVEAALWVWCESAIANNGPLHDHILVAKALAIATGLGLDPVEFRASKGWLQRIKSRCRLHQVTSHLQEMREGWQEVIARYDPNDVYTIDETALFYRMAPKKTLSNMAGREQKLHKERMSVLLGCNMTGTVRLKPLVIGTEAHPQSFPESVERVCAAHGIDYRHNKKAWMTMPIFEDWMKRLNREKAARGEHILLLFDDCPGHRLAQLQLSNVCVKFLLSDIVLQPMNIGIIRAFKACYRRLWVEWTMQEFDNNRYSSVIDFYQAVIMLGKAWSQVKSSTFVNCWRKTGIVPKLSVSQALDATRFLEQEGRDERKEIQRLLYSTYSGVEFTTEDIEQFISDPEEFEETVHEEPTIDELVAVAKSKMKLLEEEEEDTEMDPSDIECTPLPEVSLATATVHAKTVHDYLIMSKPKVEILKAINIVRAHLEETASASKKQTSLDSFRTS